MAVQIVKSLQYLNFRDRNLQQKFERRLTARFREIKPEKFVSATSVRKPLRMLVSEKTRVPARAHSHWRVHAAFVFRHLAQNHNSSYCRNTSGTYLECGVLFQRAAELACVILHARGAYAYLKPGLNDLTLLYNIC